MHNNTVLHGIRMPEELVLDALHEAGINIDSISHVAENHGLFYLKHHKYVSALGQVVHLINGTGRIEYYLKNRDNPMSLDNAKFQANLLFMEGGRRVRLYKAIDIVFKNGRVAETIYIFVEVADLK